MPIERVVVPPFVFLAELSAHEQKLLAGMAEHETVIGAQICKALPFVARQAAEDGALAVHDLVMGERQDKIFGERVVQAEQDLTVMMLAVDRIPADVFERVVHPSHIPLVAESQPAPVNRLRYHRPRRRRAARRCDIGRARISHWRGGNWRLRYARNYKRACSSRDGGPASDWHVRKLPCRRID